MVVCKWVVICSVVTTIHCVDVVELAASSLLEGSGVGKVTFRYRYFNCERTGAFSSIARHTEIKCIQIQAADLCIVGYALHAALKRYNMSQVVKINLRRIEGNYGKGKKTDIRYFALLIAF